ncbi:hypothetical protein GWK47_042064 [Chionoecetes opilio]|uniref:Uncharacterized protein n=1 Tax=Chionoecetes opilio TaxID=41210 RepID=A0A8J4YNE0_CHIOP|nr:hypothetical protein GWK47_042064 [Chionoecetes opilio]
MTPPGSLSSPAPVKNAWNGGAISPGYPLVVTSHKYALKHCSLGTLAAHGRLFLIQNPCTRHGVFGSAYQDEDMDNDFRALLKETNAVHLQQSYEPSPATKFITLPELAQQFQREQCTSFIVDLSQHFTDTIRENIRKFTKAQAKFFSMEKNKELEP